ncbi:hypothetical protein LJC59_00040 [Desulfovibrio sp. OttesenSCG-928-A18]|nr:hypothetical protein [Desulfovibrio sp. OttesenSCG-928-A18]
MPKAKHPKGIIGIFTSPEGSVTATAPVFESLSRFNQEVLAARRLALEVARAYCAPDFANSMSEHDREKTMNAMRANGFKVTYITIGYEDDDNANA